MGIEFKVAAAAERGEDDVIDVAFPEPIGVVQAHRPTVAQAEILGAQLRTNPTVTALAFVRVCLGETVEAYLRELLLEGAIEREDLIGGWGENDQGRNEKGLIDDLMEQFTGRPTVPSTGSSRSQSTGGRRSTGRSPGKGSTHSASPSTAS